MIHCDIIKQNLKNLWDNVQSLVDNGMKTTLNRESFD